jgi:hypothetical protein
MKKPKPQEPGQNQSRAGPYDGVVRRIERKPPPTPGGPAPAGPEPTMAEGAARAKTRGRLDRAVLVMLGKGLEDCFDEIRRQEVPERFKLLLQQFQ